MITVSGIEIKYSELLEIAQGSPQVGQITVNGIKLEGRYTGPALFDGKYLYIPRLEKKLFTNYFQLVQIDTETQIQRKIGELHHLIWIQRIQDQTLYFNDSIDQIKLLSYLIEGDT